MKPAIKKRRTCVVICIVDSTLAMLDEKKISCRQVLMFIQYMKQIGVVNFEVSSKVYNMIKNKSIHNIRFYIITSTCDSKDKKEFTNKIYLGRHEEELCMKTMALNKALDITDLEEIPANSYVRILGLSELLCVPYKQEMEKVKSTFGKKRINFCPSDRLHCATATALTWILSGFGEEVTTSFAGIGMRPATEEVILALYLNGRYDKQAKLNYFDRLRNLFEEMTGAKICFMKPVIGESIFNVESGIHVDGIAKNPKNYELYSPELVGKKSCLIIGKDSGKKSIQLKLQQLGISSSFDKVQNLLNQVRKTSVSLGRNITDNEFIQIANEVKPECELQK